MAITVERSDTFEQWRVKTNQIAVFTDNIGNLQQLVTVTKSNVVAAINETQTNANIISGNAIFTTANVTTLNAVTGILTTANVTTLNVKTNLTLNSYSGNVGETIISQGAGNIPVWGPATPPYLLMAQGIV